MIVQHSYDEMFARSGIDMKLRELTACLALAAAGPATTEIPFTCTSTPL